MDIERAIRNKINFKSTNNFNDKKPIPAIKVEEEFAHSPLNKLSFEFETEVIAAINYTRLDKAIENTSKNVGMKDYKTVLQEKLQENGQVLIEYKIIKEQGPDHNKVFTAEVKCNGKILAQGEGTTKKLAEMEAAKRALHAL